MGVFDFVKQGVRAGMIARADTQKHLIVFKHPDQNFPMYSQLTVDMDEVAVFFKDGRVVGVLPPGRHTMQTQNIPFLAGLVNSFTGGNVFISELFFVKTTPVRGVPFGGPAGEIVDPSTGLQVPIRIFGEFSVMVIDPVRFVVGYSGQAASGDNDQILSWIKGKFLNSVTTVLTELCEQEQKSILSVINNKERLAAAFVQRAPNLNEIGIRITEMGKIDPNIPEKYMQELRDAVKELAVAQREVRKKQIAIAGAQADAQSKQFELDQGFNQEYRNVQQLAGGNLQGYANARMAIGAGQGMAAHGTGGGIAGLGAQMAVGVGMGNMMASQMAPMPPTAGYGPPPVTGSVPVQPMGEVSCQACQAKQPSGKFCRECGVNLTPPRKFCGGCGIEVGVMAKFCPNCGSAQAAPGGPPIATR
jgi:membrane protease subunit (stomatin/prohibitin family)